MDKHNVQTEQSIVDDTKLTSIIRNPRKAIGAVLERIAIYLQEI
jgi:hypothetical protein